ncbi:MAG: hypothetical protein QW725_07985 [Ignisphaera sp.]
MPSRALHLTYNLDIRLFSEAIVLSIDSEIYIVVEVLIELNYSVIKILIYFYLNEHG